jgi:long-chain fatty acid transport protein
MLAGALACLSLTNDGDARAAGLYFGDRGVRPLARGGAFVAGADDLGAVAYNPAGSVDAGGQFLFDASWVRFGNEYTRRAWVEQRDPNTGEVIGGTTRSFPTVTGASAVLPLPTLAGSYRIREEMVVTLAAFAPYAAITSYPETVAGKPAPQRYSLLTLEGSALGVVGAYVGYRPHARVSVGAGIEALVGRFAATTMFSACVPDRFLCAPEQPEWDTLTELAAGPIVAPTGIVGAKVRATSSLTFGASFHLPVFVRAPATIRTRLPATVAFAAATQVGDSASIAFDLPWTALFGVEWRPLDGLALELAGSAQGWGMHDAIRVNPEGVALSGVVGYPDPYRMPEQRLERGFQESFSVRLGAEYTRAFDKVALTIRGGASFESSAVPPDRITVLTVDGPKGTLALGTGLGFGRWRFDAVYAHIFVAGTDLDPRDARGLLLVPVATNAAPHYVNGGAYRSSGDVLGMGFTYSFGSLDPARDVNVPAAAAPGRKEREPVPVR